jgi:hypothetical protein
MEAEPAIYQRDLRIELEEKGGVSQVPLYGDLSLESLALLGINENDPDLLSAVNLEVAARLKPYSNERFRNELLKEVIFKRQYDDLMVVAKKTHDAYMALKQAEEKEVSNGE